ncbi:WD40 repeat domain-containing protein [Streptomyces sp. NBC_00588]|uniref:WD40 repeat domain-containing protein n=1 Tax=Streptomyces sp. NBC_00588 TaxID=2975784 RepID=UPI002E8095A5|nr:WD40 repeat domain-containing protein [Streptomyces sp. NBC_00588]WUB34943.1 WD40 domain-containing protein [Streptomyces sp. NBC_00588]
MAVVAGVAAWRQGGVNARQRDEAEARRVAALVDTLRESEPRTAMRLALAAWRSGQDTFTQPEEGGRALNAPSWLSGDGRVLTKVAHDRVLQWEVRTHRQIRSVHVPGLSQGVVDVSDDGRFAPTGRQTDAGGRFGPGGHTYLVGRNAHDPDGDRMVLWSALAFSADGSLFAASAGDGSVQVWETARTRLPAATVPVGDGPVPALGFGPHARELHIATPHLPDRVAQLRPSRAAAEVCARAGGGATEAEWHQYLQAVPYRDTCRP